MNTHTKSFRLGPWHTGLLPRCAALSRSLPSLGLLPHMQIELGRLFVLFWTPPKGSASLFLSPKARLQDIRGAVKTSDAGEGFLRLRKIRELEGIDADRVAPG